MALASILSRSSDGIHAPQVHVEIDISNGLPSLSIVGLPATTVKESKDRVRAAIINSRFEFPAKRITVNLAPADIPKDGGRFDLPIAIGILVASGQIPGESLTNFECIGELSLGGQVRPVKGVLPSALAVAKEKRQLVIPTDNANEACLIETLDVYPIKHLAELTAHLLGIEKIQPWTFQQQTTHESHTVDLSEVKGQHHAKRALEIAATGGHNLLMAGPPGTGKTMLAKRLPSLLPPMTQGEALEAATIASISQQGFKVKQWGHRPFRDPHHTSSGIALVGGGAKVQPGEISLAHHGVLFLDELMQFDRGVLDVLREPLESGAINISRATRQASYPANFQLIVAFNFCPQGLSCDLEENCHCTTEQKRRYLSKLSAPFLDRIDLHIEVPRIPRDDLLNSTSGESSKTVRDRVIQAREHQHKRQNKVNVDLSNNEIERFCALSKTDQTLISNAIDKFRLSARAYHRILKVARSIADLEGSENIQTHHLMEALSYRTLALFNSQQHVAF